MNPINPLCFTSQPGTVFSAWFFASQGIPPRLRCSSPRDHLEVTHGSATMGTPGKTMDETMVETNHR